MNQEPADQLPADYDEHTEPPDFDQRQEDQRQQLRKWVEKAYKMSAADALEAARPLWQSLEDREDHEDHHD